MIKKVFHVLDFMSDVELHHSDYTQVNTATR